MSGKLLVIDTWSNSLDLCIRAKAAGWEVMWYDQPRKDGSERRAGEGIITKIRDFDALRKKWLGWADLIFLADNTAYLSILEPFRKIGYPIFGCNELAADLELDRDIGQKAMKDCGLPVLPSKPFHDYDEAAAFVKKNPKFLVSKPSGDADKALSYVADDAASLVYMLKRWKKNEKYRRDARVAGFILQEKMSGTEMAVGGWFGPHGWGRLWFENFEFKKLMDGDLGVNTGEQGTLGRYVRQSKLADKVLEPITERLHELAYVGYCDVNCMIDEDGTPWPLEFTMRPGWPTIHNQVALHEGDPVQWMLDCISGFDTLTAKVDTPSISVVMSIPDYPYSKLTNKEVCGIPIYNAGADNIHLSEVMLCDDTPVQIGETVVEMPCYVTAGDYVLVATGVGDTITGARRSAYSAIRKVSTPGQPMYRLDIGKGRLVNQLPLIQEMGYAEGLRY